MSHDLARSRVVRRALEVARLLAEEPLSLAELGARMGADQRTARRYVYALRSAGVDVSIAGVDDETDERDASEPIAFRYQLDPRAWAGLLWLPRD